LRGYLKQYLPERVNEIVGLQHMKFFIFDDSIIISGFESTLYVGGGLKVDFRANLSQTYFTNRQDRYIVIENNPKLVEFFVAVFEAVSACSVALVKNGCLQILPTVDQLPFHGLIL
jgi:CDP-diacylglycerol--glycerol-3-phosphate 3-phosphatidyltransferase